MSEAKNRAHRRARERAERSSRQRLKKGLVALTAVAALGGGTVMAPASQVYAAESAAPGMDRTSLDLGAILGMIDDPMVAQYVEMCRTGSLATGPNSSNGTEFDPDNPPLAIADCVNSNGTGIALVLPDRLEIGQAAENMELDLGDDINLLLIKYRMGKRNLLEVLGGVTLGSDTIKGAAELLGMPRVDPGAFNKYKTYEAIQNDAALPVVMERYCTGPVVFGNCVGSWKDRDKNLAKRTEALKMAEYLTGHKYDYSTPQNLPSPAKPIGKSTISGDGVNVALSMRGGSALAQTGNAIALALAAADKGRTSTASATWGVAMAANMNTDDIKFTWFGQEIDFSKLRDSGLLDSPMAGDAGADASGMLDSLEGINGNIPALKEVACFGVEAKATAEGLGSCTNYLGTFDYYKDLRPVTDGGHRQTQYGLTDVTSLFMGNDALLKQFGPLLSGDDMSGLMDTPFMGDLLGALTSEDQRLKFAKDFVRYTQDVETIFAKEPVLDANGDPVLDDDGNPVMRVKQTPRMVGATHVEDQKYDAPVMVQERDADDNLLWVDAKGNPVEVGTEGALPKMVQKLDADGEPVTEQKTRKVTVPTMVDELDADGQPIWVDAEGNVVPDGTEGAVKKQVQQMVQAKDYDGKPIFDPVIEKTTTAHWLTSDYGLREPLVISWLGHELVFFPPVEVNGSTRPNLIGLPQIRKIADDAQAGLLPKISLVQWDNAFGFGTLSLDNPFDPFGTLTNYLNTVTVVDDLKGVGGLIGQLTAKPDAPAEPDVPVDPTEPDAEPAVGAETVVTSSRPDLPAIEVSPTPELAPMEIVIPAPAPEMEPAPTTAPEQSETSAPADTPAADEPALEPVG
ncbi:hypothetical protein [Gordonia sp. (in: high G+C Gram-positive bacteria)]|uniref:hypothetical protein n=1 Tax=Gordonia sp. (in: high G+C Gram-positive bacteria) TaxID=84139 RepID=UPI003C75FF69